MGQADPSRQPQGGVRSMPSGRYSIFPLRSVGGLSPGQAEIPVHLSYHQLWQATLRATRADVLARYGSHVGQS
jgi:hypothetical protein